MTDNIVVKMGPSGLASSITITSKEMTCYIQKQAHDYIFADVTAPNTAFHVDIYRLPQEDDLYWVDVEPFGFSGAVSLAEWGFPGKTYETAIPDPHMQTMVAEAMVMLTIVMGRSGSDLRACCDVLTMDIVT